jgi:molybdate transport system substrate-binding protein
MFEKETSIKVDYDFDGSGRLGTKILMGVGADLFIPGSNKWALKLKDEGHVETCYPIAYHTPVIITPKGSQLVRTLNDLSRKDLKLALGDLKATAIGRNNLKMFKKAGLNPDEMNIVARGINIKQVVQWVESGAADAAIVWRADAVQSGQVEIIEIPQELNLIETIPMCLLTQAQHRPEASRLLDFLRSRGPAVFAGHGFNPVENQQ